MIPLLQKIVKKMNIQSITNAISSMFKKMRNPAPKVAPMLIGLGGDQRPGLSTVISTSNIVKALDKHGIPTGAAADGSENKTVAVVIAIVEEIYRAMHEDLNLQLSIRPGNVTVVTTGTNEGGPMIAQGINTNYVEGTAIAQ